MYPASELDLRLFFKERFVDSGLAYSVKLVNNKKLVLGSYATY